MAQRINQKERAWEFLRHELAPDIALVQEALAPDALSAGEHFIYPVMETGTIGACGVWSRALPLHRVPLETTPPTALTVCAVTLHGGKRPVLAVSMHAIFATTLNITSNLRRIISDLSPLLVEIEYKGRVILGGNWNVDHYYDKINLGEKPLNTVTIERLNPRFYGLQECNKGPHETIRHQNQVPSQDDIICVSKALVPKPVSCVVVGHSVVNNLSDHLPVVAVLEV